MRTLIFPVLGGRGNRYFQLNAALSIAQSLGYKRIFCLVRKKEKFTFEELDIDMKSPLISGIDFQYLRLEGLLGKTVWKLIYLQIRYSSESKISLLRIKSLSGSILAILLSLMLGKVVKVFTSDNTGYSEIPKARNSMLCIGYFQSLKYGNTVKYLYKRNKESIDEEATDVTKRAMIHIRRGDYLQSPELGVLKITYYRKIVNELLKEVPSLNFSVFSDEALGESAIKAMLGDEVPSDRLSLFFGNSFDESETFSIMSRYFDYYVIANSSFSYWATVIGQEDGSRVFCPFPWFNIAPTPQFIYNSGWICVPAVFIEDPLVEDETK